MDGIANFIVSHAYGWPLIFVGVIGLLASIGGMTHQWIAVAVLMMLWTICIVWIAQ